MEHCPEHSGLEEKINNMNINLLKLDERQDKNQKETNSKLDKNNDKLDIITNNMADVKTKLLADQIENKWKFRMTVMGWALGGGTAGGFLGQGLWKWVGGLFIK